MLQQKIIPRKQVYGKSDECFKKVKQFIPQYTTPHQQLDYL